MLGFKLDRGKLLSILYEPGPSRRWSYILVFKSLHAVEKIGLFLLHLVTDFLMAKLQPLQKQLGVLGDSGKLLYLQSQFLLNFFKSLHIILSHNSNGFALLANSRCPSHSVYVAFRIAKVVIDDKLNHWNVYAPRCHVGTDQ